ncbi:UDP-N-acetylenolpyruvoylglucosamine reductase [Thermococci archaeon]|nr:MAG: UDP-N-acetylenolpyruvoylglucosamine reductase [Thermococci archaeon]
MKIPKFIKENVKLDTYSTIGIGGTARFFAEPRDIEQLRQALRFSKENEVPFFVLGGGSNTLFPDTVYNGIVIRMAKFNKVRIRGEECVVSAGFLLPRLIFLLQQESLSGLEELFEIPGTVGGAVYMNAGSFGREIGEAVQSVKVLTYDGDLITLSGQELNFSYRHSDLSRFGILLEVSLKLKKSSPYKILRVMEKVRRKRRKTQPVGERTLGSAFKNPEGKSAGLLIDKAGLRGYSYGGAKFSKKHANFIVNFKDASQKDVLYLLKLGKEKVKEKFGEELEEEIIILKGGVHG